MLTHPRCGQEARPATSLRRPLPYRPSRDTAWTQAARGQIAKENDMPGPVSDSYQGPSEDGPYVRCRGAMVTARRCVLAGTMRAITTMRDNASMRLAAAVRG